jgi:hypothetical protein
MEIELLEGENEKKNSIKKWSKKINWVNSGQSTNLVIQVMSSG